MHLQQDSEVHIHWKGAAEIVLSCCTHYIDANDNVVPLDENEVGEVILSFAWNYALCFLCCIFTSSS